MITEIMLELNDEERRKLTGEYQTLFSINNKDTERLEESMDKGLSKSSAQFHKILLNVIFIHYFKIL